MASLDKLDILNGKFKGKDIISSDQFTLQDLTLVLEKAKEMEALVQKDGGNELLKRKIMAALFYEPSSRTFGSFVTAMQRLGGGIIPIQNMENSSAGKGESLEDTVQVFAAYADVIVIRHPQVGAAKRAADAVEIPIINAGDGIGEHPTQALYDMFTIQTELHRLESLEVTFFGELGHYRPVNSLAKLLSLLPDITINFVAPKGTEVNNETREILKQKNMKFVETENLSDVLQNTDVLYVTRVKKEFMSEDLYNQIKGKYVVDSKTLKDMKQESVVMHALPRIDEISTEIDSDKRAVYLKSQVRSGLYVRMALLDLVLGKL